MVGLDFYVYGVLFYIPIALLLSYILSITECSGSAVPMDKDTISSKERKANNSNKPAANDRKKIPIGKVGHCKFCEVYLRDDTQANSHVKGKKHVSGTQGNEEQWLELYDESQVKNKNTYQKPSKFTKEEYDEGYVL